MFRFRFVFIAFYITAVLTFAVYLRGMNNRISYKLCVIEFEENHQKQLLWQKQLQIECITNPIAINQRLNKQDF